MNRLCALVGSAMVAGLVGSSSTALAQTSAPRPASDGQQGRVALSMSGNIEGVVRDERGAPLAGAMVSALGSASAVAVTDRGGAFVLRRSRQGLTWCASTCPASPRRGGNSSRCAAHRSPGRRDASNAPSPRRARRRRRRRRSSPRAWRRSAPFSTPSCSRHRRVPTTRRSRRRIAPRRPGGSVTCPGASSRTPPTGWPSTLQVTAPRTRCNRARQLPSPARWDRRSGCSPTCR